MAKEKDGRREMMVSCHCWGADYQVAMSAIGTIADMPVSAINVRFRG